MYQVKREDNNNSNKGGRIATNNFHKLLPQAHKTTSMMLNSKGSTLSSNKLKASYSRKSEVEVLALM